MSSCIECREVRYNGRRYVMAVGESCSLNIPASQYNSTANMPLFVRRRRAFTVCIVEDLLFR